MRNALKALVLSGISLGLICLPVPELIRANTVNLDAANDTGCVVNSDLGIAGGVSSTLAVFVNFDSKPASNVYYTILFKIDQGSNDEYNALTYQNNAGTITMVGHVGRLGAAEAAASVADPFDTGRTYHVALTWNASTNDATLYIDGIQRATANNAPSGGSSGGGDWADIGVWRESSNGFIRESDAKLAHAAIFNNALSAERIRRLAQQPPAANDANLIAYYPINETTGTSLEDYATSDADQDMSCTFSGAANIGYPFHSSVPYQ